MPTLDLTLLDPILAVCRLEPGAAVPDWALRGAFTSITRTAEELSIVCEADAVPGDVRRETGFRALKVAGPLDFSLSGILAALAVPLADAGVSVFALSTFDTDYLLVREAQLETALRALRAAGHRIAPGPAPA